MTIEEKVKSTPLEQRPKINYNGVVDHMDDEQYAEYLRMQEEIAKFPPPAPTAEERLTKLEEENAELRQALEILLGDGKVAAK